MVPDMSRSWDTKTGEGGWIGYELKTTQHRLRRRLEAELAGTGITASQNVVLQAVGRNPRISNAALAREAFITPQSMQGLLVALERDGYIRRTPHPEHGRIIMTDLTGKGRTAAHAGRDAADRVERLMLADLSADEVVHLRDLLKRCATALDGDSP